MTRKGMALVAIALAVACGLSACGKRGALEAPEGEEAQYTYPHVYPKPSTVVPAKEPQARPRSLETPGGAGGISVFPPEERTRTYGEPAPE